MEPTQRNDRWKQLLIRLIIYVVVGFLAAFLYKKL